MLVQVAAGCRPTGPNKPSRFTFPRTRHLRSRLLGGAIALFGVAIPAVHPSFAQVIPDTSLTHPSIAQTAGSTTTITGGTQRGSSLFHSFTQFSIPTHQTVQFHSIPAIRSIFSRVTGQAMSEIDGVIQTQGNTNLVLVNPNGILFGPHARFNIAGSFVATTAPSLVFEDGFEFRSQQPNDVTPILTLSVTPGIQYGKPMPGSLIQTQGILRTGQDLILQADQLKLQGQVTAGQNLLLQAQDLQIRESAALPFLAIAGSQMTLQGDRSIDILALQPGHTAFQSGGAIHLFSNGNVSADAHFSSQGDFSIRQLSGDPGQFVSLFDPIIRSNGNVTFGDYLGTALKVEAGGNITTGNITILGPDRLPSTNPQNPGGSSIPLSDPDYLALTTSPALILRAGISPFTGTGDRLPRELGIFPTFQTPFRNTAESPTGKITVQGNIATIALDSPFLQLVGLTPSTKGGDIELSATGNILSQGDIASFSTVGNGGAIKITSSSGSVNLQEKVLSLSTTGQGSPIAIAALNHINVNDIHSTGGNLQISSQMGTINTTSGILNTGIFLTDISSLINLPANLKDTLSFIGINLKIAAVQQGGNVTLNAADSIQVGTINTLGEQSSGNLSIRSTQGGITTNGILNTGVLNPRILEFSNLNIDKVLKSNNINILPLTSSKSGDISLEAHQAIQLKETAINLSTSVNGQGGSLKIMSRDTINVDNSYILSIMDGRGGGDFYLTGRSLFLNQSMIISEAGRNSQQPAGNIWVNASDVTLTNRSYLATQNRSAQPTGDLTIHSDRLFLQGESAISTSTDATAATGIGGQLNINARDRIWLSGEGRFSGAILSGSISSAKGGNIQIQTPWLRVQDSGLITAATGKDGGQAGNVNINADLVEIIGSSDADKLGPSFISVDTLFDLNGIGDAGRLTINSDRIVVQNGGLISASTFNQGTGGDILINAQDSVQISGKLAEKNIRSGIYAQSFGAGNAGSIDLTTGKLELLGGAKITVDSDTNSPDTVNVLKLVSEGLDFVKSLRSRGVKVFPDLEFSESVRSGDAGNLNVSAKSIGLNQGIISAITSSGEGGNINLQVVPDLSRTYSPLLRLRNQSEISTTAKGNGNGGNINITASFILSFPQENSDIKANAFSGRGGNVNINAYAIFWLEPRSRDDLRQLLKTDNPLELDPNRLTTNDITAISQASPQLNGVVNLNTLGLDPSRGLTALPQTVNSPKRDRRCESLPIGQGGKFVHSGRGGLALGPESNVSLRDVQSELGVPVSSSDSVASPVPSSPVALPKQPHPAVEAQGLVKTSTGEIELVAESIDS
ncbi:MAG: filamentous hemagglutinin N-terminal domain-containing protein, partial [Synechococcales bacterium]|nr:filamentous hemagglutinin N-terminal domain-containing protein [Synechococcales bacterium]